AGLMGLDQPKSLKRTSFLSFVVLGGALEFLKFLVLRFYALPLKIFKGSADGMVYGIAVSLGMSMVVLSYYILSPLLRPYEFYQVLLGTMGIAGVLSAIIMGFFVGMGKARNNRFVDSMTGLLGAAFLSGLYYFCFFTQEYLLAVLAGIVTMGIALFFVVLVLRNQES
ncbi:MAG: PrsW family glutamic-type intramembrane protease, partial [Bacteroidales bacterium]